MPPTIHFYDSQFIGGPAAGQLVSFDSLALSGDHVAQYQTKISLRPDVAFNPQSIEQGDCFALDMTGGISEYEWSRKAHDLFAAQDSLHVGVGNTGVLDSYVRFAFYRCLSLLPNTTHPAGAHYLDLLTVCRALNLLRPESMPISLPNHWGEQRKREFIFNRFPGESRSDSVKEFAKCITAASPKLMAHAIGHSSPEMIGNLCGLVDGRIESLADLKPVFLCHEQLLAGHGCGVFVALGTDPQYRNIVYMIDLQADLAALIDDRGSNVTRFIRTEASQQDRPVVRVNLNRVPFVSPLSVLDRNTATRLGIDASGVKRNAELLIDKVDICLALLEVSSASDANLNGDPDFQLYGAEYLPADRALLDQLHRSAASEWEPLITSAQDARITTLGQRLIRRCAPALLSEDDMNLWRAHCVGRLIGRANEPLIAETKAYCNTIASSNAYPPGMRTAAQHWLQTTETVNEFRKDV